MAETISIPEGTRVGTGFQKDYLEHLSEISRGSEQTFAVILLASLYSLLTIGTTTDAMLVSNSAMARLPLVDTDIAIAGFYLVAPTLLLAMYIYLHLYLQRFWRGVATMPASHADGRQLDDVIRPWIISSGFLLGVNSNLKAKQRAFARTESVICVLFAWCLVPLTLLLFAMKYLTRHDLYGSTYHAALVAVSIVAASRFYSASASNFKTADSTTATGCGRRIFVKASYLEIMIASVVVFLIVAAAGTSMISANLEGAKLSERPVDWIGRCLTPECETLIGELAAVTGASLNGRNLQNADARQAFLARADLRNADLRSSNLQSAELQGANLEKAKLDLADLSSALLQTANLSSANLTEAILDSANLQKADLQDAILVKAQLTGARLESAEGRSAHFSGANLTAAILDFAELESAVFDQKAILWKSTMNYAALNEADFRDSQMSSVEMKFAQLESAQLDRAVLTNAKLNHAYLQGARLTQARLEDIDLTGATAAEAFFDQACMRGAILKRTYLNDAKLRGVDLTGADLRGAKLKNTDFANAILTGTDVTDAVFADTSLVGADLSEVIGLTQEQLRSAFCDDATKLPPELSPGLCVRATASEDQLPERQLCDQSQ